MIAYIPSSQAAALTAALWELSDPNPTRGTMGLFRVETALDKSTWLRVPTDFSIPVRKDATLGETIPKILQPFIDAGQLPANTNDQLAAYVESKRGEQMVIYNAFPAFFKAQAKELRQMIEEGLLNEPNMIP